MSMMRSDTPDSYGIKELQGKILELMIWIDKICSENNIEYCLMGGSALGAKRHGGFIPWDDDMDIFMTNENYTKFKSLFHDRRREGFYLQEWGKRENMVTMAKVRMDNTAYIEEILAPLNIHQGIYVDIMILHKCPSSKPLQFFQYLCGRYVAAKGLADRGYCRRKDLGGIILKTLAILPKGFAIKTALKEIYRYDGKDTGFYCNFLGKSNFEKSVYPVKWIDDPECVNFETVKFKIPAQADKYLKKRFGDYMVLPNAKQIAWEQHAMQYSLNTDFRKLLNRNYENFYDEKILI